MQKLNWDNSLQNPIKRSKDISCTENLVKEYYAGSKVLPAKGRITGFVKVRTSTPFKQTKTNLWFWSWLHKHKIYIRQTTLSAKKHSNLGWFMFSHPEYTHFQTAVNDIRTRIKTRTLEFEPVAHNIVHKTSGRIKNVYKILETLSGI